MMKKSSVTRHPSGKTVSSFLTSFSDEAALPSSCYVELSVLTNDVVLAPLMTYSTATLLITQEMRGGRSLQTEWRNFSPERAVRCREEKNATRFTYIS